ncbi:Centromere protein T [Galemys pyrenaicus]|uniref:Centromere protein T n=1 Tax=Galemys pyrenaicus TaxID=202257 RepID=A0A8J6DUY4_GALPY|nr:Centromere protein T [Galemys pyrenaicus]
MPPKPVSNYAIPRLGARTRTTIPVGLCGRLARVGSNATAGRRRHGLPEPLRGWTAEAMADSYSSDSEPTTRTLLRRVLDTADPRTPRRPRSARARYRRCSLHSAQGALPETPSLRRRSSQTKMTARRISYRTRSTGKLTHIQASGHLEEQTPRSLLKNILLTAPESSIVIPEPVVKPVPAPQIVQPSRLENSRGSLELQLPELEPSTILAPGLLAPGRKKQRLRLSVFQQGMDQEPPVPQGEVLYKLWDPLHLSSEEEEKVLLGLDNSSSFLFFKYPFAEPHGNANASSLTSSLSLTFATPLQPQSVRRPGLARRPLARRAVDVSAFLQDLRDTSLALASSGDSLRTPVAALPTDMVLEDTQPFSQPLVGLPHSVSHSLPGPSHMGAKGAERPVSHGTWYSEPGLQNNSDEEPAPFLTGKEEKADALAMNLLSMSPSHVSGEDGVEPLQDGAGEEAEERMGESLSMSKVKEALVAQESPGAEQHEGDTDMTETEGSWEAAKASVPEESSGNDDTTGRTASPELVSGIIPEFLQTRQHQLLEPATPPSPAVLPSEPVEPLSVRLPPKARIPRPRQDPHKAGLSHYAKLFSFYAKMPMEKAAFEMVEKCLDKYFQHLCDDLEVFAAHAGRRTVMPEDLELLLRRQGLVTDHVSLHVLVERHLPLEYRQLLIPCAFSGNSVFPAQ